MPSFINFRTFIVLSVIGLNQGFILPDTSQNASVNAMYTVFKSEIAKLNNQLTNFRIDFSNIKVDNDKLKSTFKDLTMNYASIRNELTNTTRENSKLQLNINDLKAEVAKTERDQAALTPEFVAIKHDFNSLGSKYTDLERFYENLTDSGSQGQAVFNPSTLAPRVAFSVTSPDGTFSRDGALNFTKFNYNDEGAFNFSSGKFECEVPGLYFFSSTLIREPGGYPESFCYLMIKGHALAYLGGYGYNASIGHPSGTATMVAHMDQGDVAYIGMCGVIHQIGDYSNFNGFLINAD